jgi:hypothetical protein
VALGRGRRSSPHSAGAVGARGGLRMAHADVVHGPLPGVQRLAGALHAPAGTLRRTRTRERHRVGNGERRSVGGQQALFLARGGVWVGRACPRAQPGTPPVSASLWSSLQPLVSTRHDSLPERCWVKCSTRTWTCRIWARTRRCPGRGSAARSSPWTAPTAHSSTSCTMKSAPRTSVTTSTTRFALTPLSELPRPRSLSTSCCNLLPLSDGWCVGRCHQIPHYHAREATHAIQKAFPAFYLYDPTRVEGSAARGGPLHRCHALRRRVGVPRPQPTHQNTFCQVTSTAHPSGESVQCHRPKPVRVLPGSDTHSSLLCVV